MIIKSVVLRNIRSYLAETITFPEGSTLLAGEIGSGKSSVLLAIEFALFGIARGVLSGGSLLRLGESEGYVELEFSIDEKNCIVRRNLKRVKDEVRQDTGYIQVNGDKQDCTPVELKSIILDLLGYPKQLLTKSKSLIYRYTVYTPQEQMKQILLEEGEARLDTLRRLFQIDKYQRIRENTIFLLRDLRQRQATIRGSIQDLDEKERQLSVFEKELESSEKELGRTLPLLAQATQKLKEKQSQIKTKEAEIKKLGELKNLHAAAAAQAGEKYSQLQGNTQEIDNLKKDLAQLEKKLSDTKDEKLEDTSDLDAGLEVEETKKSSLLQHKSALETEIRTSKKSIQELEKLTIDISSLKKCPMCLQDISQSHISHIRSEQDSKISAFSQAISQATEKFSSVSIELAKTEQSLFGLKQSIKQHNELLLALKERQNLSNLIEEKQDRLQLLESRQKDLKKEIGALSARKLELDDKINTFKEIEKEYKILRAELEILEKNEKSLLVETSRLKAGSDNLKNNKKLILQEITEKKVAKDELTILTQRQNWLQVIFANLMTTMEQHVMMRVYNEFNDIFQEYFSMLLEDAVLSVNLDESFNPVVAQNGCEIYYEDLSGGEKTSIALAYRLALNRVTNDLIETIKTKDIVILDEPTDGFSTEQLDKMRSVLENLNTKQTIIVSHESKIESFVDNIIRISKREHTSSVTS